MLPLWIHARHCLDHGVLLIACRRELDFALQKLKNTKTCCVVPVLLRECGKLSSDITALTYLDATNNGRGERFINRLCDSLGEDF